MDVYQSLQVVVSDVCKSAPVAGRLVRVVRGKHKGESGRVIRNVVSRFADTRYQTWMQKALWDARATDGHRVLIKTDLGEFWVDADKVEVVS